MFPKILLVDKAYEDQDSGHFSLCMVFEGHTESCLGNPYDIDILSPLKL